MSANNELLKKHWGFDALRPLQQQAVDSILNKNDTLVLLPTGGGKSVCYQLPALQNEGVAIVVSPLISLMQDQVAQLQKRNIKAMHLAGALRQKELDKLLSNAAYGDYKLLYISPERLQNEWVLERLCNMNISLIAVDEAHCISQWGFDFRPSYLHIKNLRKAMPNVPTMALTASATSKVIDDIKSQLLLDNPTIVRDTFFRTNLSLNLIFSERKEARCRALLKRTKGTAVVYLRSRKGTVELADFLSKNGIAAQHYHAGMDAQEREDAQAKWTRGNTRVMVATNAFGMGIDKADVRLVIHLGVPQSPEEYYQEIGRAGRDGKPAHCFLYYNESDVSQLENVHQDEPKIKVIQQIYAAFFSEHRIAIGAGKYSERPLYIYPFSSKYKFSSRHVHQAFSLLHRMEYLIYQDVSNRPSSVKFIWDDKDLYYFQIKNPTLEPITKALLRLYPGITQQRINISEEALSRKTKFPIIKVIKHIEILAKRGILRYKKRYKGTTITLLTERLPDSHIRIAPEMLKLRMQNKKRRAEAMLNLLGNTEVCRMQQLVEYFGETNETRCGHCDVCLADKPLNIAEKIEKFATEDGISLESLVESFPHISAKRIENEVSNLLEAEKVKLLENGRISSC